VPVPRCPAGWPYASWFRLARRRLPAAAEVRASAAGRRAWVTVYPEGWQFGRPAWDADRQDAGAYLVWYYEVEEANYAEAVEAVDRDRPGLLLNEQRVSVESDRKLRTTLRRWIEDLGALRDPTTTTAPV
jgi:hypothetical protein